jgi:hypothetical protein
VYYLELCGDLTMHSMALLHHTYVLLQHGLRYYMASFLLLLGIKGCASSLWQRLQQHRSFRAATERLNAACTLVSSTDVAGEDCAICRDALYGARQLHCGHCFHLSCLRALLQQTGPASFCCPLCRRRVLPSSPAGMRRQASAAGPISWVPSAAALSRSSSQDSDLNNNGMSLEDEEGLEDPGSPLGSEEQQILEDRAYALMLQQQEQQMYEQEQEELRRVHQLLEREYGAARSRGVVWQLLTGAWLMALLRRPAATVSEAAAAAAAGAAQPRPRPSQPSLGLQESPAAVRRAQPHSAASPVTRAAAAHPRARPAPARKRGLTQLLQQQAVAAWGWLLKALRCVAQPVMASGRRGGQLQAGLSVSAAAPATNGSPVRRQRPASGRRGRST